MVSPRPILLGRVLSSLSAWWGLAVASVSGTIPSSIVKVTTSLGVMWRGTNGADWFVIGGTKVSSTLLGSAGNDTAVFTEGTFGRYKITQHADSSLEVRDTVGSAVTHLASIETLKFGRTVYDVASGIIGVASAGHKTPFVATTASSVLVSGTDYADTITTSGVGKLSVKIDGGLGLDTVSFTSGKFDWYRLTKNADGMITVKDAYATPTTTTLANVEKLKFGDLVYDVISGKVSGAAVSSLAAPAPEVITTVTTSTALLITGTSGNDVFEVTPLDRVFRTIVGGNGNDKVDFKTGYVEFYKVTRNSDGSVDVVESHATGTKTHIVGVETIKLGNALYDVATGATTPLVVSGGSSSSSSGASSSTGGMSSTPVADSVSFDSSGGVHSGGANVVDVAVVNSGATARPAGFWTFGQVFKQGDLPAGAELDAVINGQPVTLQVDVKNTWDDGSVKHAVLTVKTPALAAGASATIELMRDSTPDAHGPALTVSQMLAGDLDVKLELSNLNGGSITLDAKAVLAQAMAAGTVKTWLAGENAIEVAVRARINNQLEAEFDIRYHADGTYTTDVIVRNDWAFSATSKINYDVAIKDHGTTLFSQVNVNQNQYSTWHEVVTSARGLSTVYGKFDAQYLKESGAIPAYDLSYDPSSSTLAAAKSALTATDQSLMGNAGVARGMGSTGDRGDIGPLPEWASQYLRVMDANTTADLFAKADASGAIPWHVRDNATGAAVTLEDHPKFWFDNRAVGKSAYEAPTGLSGSTSPYSGTGWTPETSHQPSLTYLPYLVSGSQYYLSETTSEVSWILAANNWNKATFELAMSNSQTRGQAWMLRDLSNLVFALPESDPDYGYYKGVLDKNLDYLVKTFITDGAHARYGELDGFFGEGMAITGAREPGAISPWMEDFYAMVLGTLAERGYAQAVDLLNWQSGFLAQRFLNEDFNHFMGSGYRTIINNPYTGEALTNWADVNKYTQDIMYNDVAPTVQDGYPALGLGYAAIARASMASLARVGNLDGAEAYGYLVEQSPNISYASVTKFGMAFRFGMDGEEVALADHKVGTTGADALTGSERADVLVGGKGNDTISGGQGSDALYGSDGNDQLNGGTGNDALFGGAGSDTINGNAGNDIIRGGSGADSLRGEAGADLFVFGPGDGADILFDFSAGRTGTDVIDLSDFVDAGRLVERDGNAGLGLGDLFFNPPGAATPYFTIVNGAYMLDFGHGDTILFKGLGINTQFYADDFVF